MVYKITSGDDVFYSDTLVPITLHENGCYVEVPESQATGFTVKQLKEFTNEEDGTTYEAYVDVVFRLSSRALKRTEPIGDYELVENPE